MIRTYHRPATLDEALRLLDDPGAAVLAGGTDLNGDAIGAPSIVVDVQDLGLDKISADGGIVHIGATATLQALVDSDLVPELIRDLAHREAPNTFRNAATAGGVIGASEPESELLAGFLVFDALVTVVGTAGASTVPLGDILDDPELAAGGIIIEIAVPTGGHTAADRTGRTPADRPIVMVAGRLDDANTLRLVATGVAANPAPIDLDSLYELDPPGDFRGSSGYRRHLAGVLGARVVRELRGGSS
jgi:CO/xanthine dehydrogenase FAD-binding subunit